MIVNGMIFPKAYMASPPEGAPGCSEYAGILRSDAECENCGMKCGDHDLTFEQAVQVADYMSL